MPAEQMASIWVIYSHLWNDLVPSLEQFYLEQFLPGAGGDSEKKNLSVYYSLLCRQTVVKFIQIAIIICLSYSIIA